MDKPHSEISPNPWLSKGAVYSAIGRVQVQPSDEAGHVYRFIRLSANARIISLELILDEMSLGGVFGFYHPQGSSGNIGFPVQKKKWNPNSQKEEIEKSFESILGEFDLEAESKVDLLRLVSISDSEKRIFELLDLEDLQHKTVDLCFTLKENKKSNGHMAMKIQYTI